MPTLKVICRQPGDAWERTTGCHKYCDKSALEDVIQYCMQPDKTQYMGSCGVSLTQPAFEMQRLAEAYGKTGGLHLRHMVLSFSKAEIQKISRSRKRVLEVLYRIGSYVMQYYKSEYQILFAIHEDADHLHIHFVMNTVSYVDGKKYRGDKADYYAFQSYLESFLSSYYGMSLMTVSGQAETMLPARPMA